MKLISSYKLNAAEVQVELEGKPVRVPESGSYLEKSGALWCVRSKNPNDKNFGCYSSKEEAQAHMNALLAYGTSEGVRKEWEERGSNVWDSVRKSRMQELSKQRVKSTKENAELAELTKHFNTLNAVSQYGNTGWQYGRQVAREAGYIPARNLAGFPRSGGGRRNVRPLGRSAPVKHGIGKGTGYGVKVPTHSKIIRPPSMGMMPKLPMPKASPMGRMPKASPLGRSPQLQGFADMGEPMAGNMSHAHIDPVTWFRPPSLTKREKPGEDNHVPADNPREKNDKFLDVTKRNSKDTLEQKYKMLKRSAPAGLIPARTTAVEPNMAYYAPLSQMLSSVKKTRKILKGSNFTSYSRRGCI